MSMVFPDPAFVKTTVDLGTRQQLILPARRMIEKMGMREQIPGLINKLGRIELFIIGVDQAEAGYRSNKFMAFLYDALGLPF